LYSGNLQNARLWFGNERVVEKLLEDFGADLGHHVHLQRLHVLRLLAGDPAELKLLKGKIAL
jgi:hypothetical protein